VTKEPHRSFPFHPHHAPHQLFPNLHGIHVSFPCCLCTSCDL
jgi:hypothetical protein